MTAAPVVPTCQWCCVASIRSEEIRIERINGYSYESYNIVPVFQTVENDRSLDTTKSPDWMEYIELQENRTHETGGAGAYDTFRCDLVLETTSASPWRIWGQEFHLERLQESYRSISPCQGQKLEDSMKMARKVSECMVRDLLEEAQCATVLQQGVSRGSNSSVWEDISIQLVRVTVLWSPPRESDEIVVRAHAYSSGKPLGIRQAYTPIVTSIAAKRHKKSQIVVDTSMPSRMHDPHNKIASWTRLRKKMEMKETYKPPGVSEILMVRPFGGSTEILEGTSSNVFVVYKDGTLRTAKEGVLNGYARHLVLECAGSCGLKVDFRPILLQDAEKGLWEEAFITSSSRLIYPISEVLVHTDNEHEFVKYWRDPVLVRVKDGVIPRPTPKWKQMLDKILSKPYPHFRRNEWMNEEL